MKSFVVLRVLPLGCQAVLLVPAPFVDLGHAEACLIGNLLALGVAPGWVTLELLLQEQLLLVVFLDAALPLIFL